jgi:hypothetical protein
MRVPNIRKPILCTGRMGFSFGSQGILPKTV